MIINNIKLNPYSIPFVKTFHTAGNSFEHREGVWVTVENESLVGIGEAAPLPGFSEENLQDVNYAIEGFKYAVQNEDIDLEELFTLIAIHSEGVPSVRFALETAIFDILSIKNNIPLAEYINPNCNKNISINGIYGLHLPEDGFKIIKVKVGSMNLFDEIERMDNISSLFGKDVQFRLDLNGALDLAKAIRFCKEMERYNIEFIEQPLPADSLEDVAELRYHTSIPIALDESLTNIKSAREIIDFQAADIFIIKPMISGGFSESNEIINLAKSEKIRSIITTSLESYIGQYACLHLTAANDISESCGLSTGNFLNDKNISFQINDGVASIFNKPGLGVELNL